MKRATNLLFLMPQMGIGGSERLVLKLAQGLDRAHFRPSVAWLTEEPPLPEFRALDVPLFAIPKRKRIDIATVGALRRNIVRNEIDVVNAQHFMPAILARLALTGIGRTALTFTAHSAWEVNDMPTKWRLAGHHLLARMDACIGVAPDVSCALRTVFRLPASSTVTIENGVDLNIFGGNSSGSVRASLELQEADFLFGIVANLKEVKNHMFLLRAIPDMIRSNPTIKLLIVGQGFAGDSDNTEASLRAFVSGQGLEANVRFLGYRADIPEILKALDAFCLVSLREGLPIGLIEAMAAGLPVIGTRVEGIRDVIEDGTDGLLVDLDDVSSLRRAMQTLVDQPGLRKELGEKARNKAEKKYSLKRCIGQYEHLFESVRRY